jgi:hypothetical protein
LLVAQKDVAPSLTQPQHQSLPHTFLKLWEYISTSAGLSDEAGAAAVARREAEACQRQGVQEMGMLRNNDFFFGKINKDADF